MTKSHAKIHDLPIGVPIMLFDSIEEIDRHAKSPGTALRWANDRLRNVLNQRASDLFCKELERVSKFERKKGQTNGDYIRAFRVAVETGKHVIARPTMDLEAYLQFVANSIVPIVWNPEDYIKKANKVSQKAIEQAKIVVGNGNFASCVDKLAKSGIVVPAGCTSYEEQVNALAVAIDEHTKREMERNFL